MKRNWPTWLVSMSQVGMNPVRDSPVEHVVDQHEQAPEDHRADHRAEHPGGAAEDQDRVGEEGEVR